MHRRLLEVVAHYFVAAQYAVAAVVLGIVDVAQKDRVVAICVANTVDHDIYLVADAGMAPGGVVDYRAGALLVEEAHLYVVPPLVVFAEFAQACAAEAAYAVDHDLWLEPGHEGIGDGTFGNVGATLGAQHYAVGRYGDFNTTAGVAVCTFETVEYVVGRHHGRLGHHHGRLA